MLADMECSRVEGDKNALLDPRLLSGDKRLQTLETGAKKTQMAETAKFFLQIDYFFCNLFSGLTVLVWHIWYHLWCS